MENNEIKQANRKALPKFLLVVLACGVVGGIIGYCAGSADADSLSSGIYAAIFFFGEHVAHWLLLAIAVVTAAVCIPMYRSAKKLLSTWDGEDEDISERADGKITRVVWASNTALILAFFVLTASYCAAHEIIDHVVFFFLGIVSFLAVLAEAVVLQQKCVDTFKQMNPEKQGSVYDMKFRKKWMDSCDEAEKIIIGQCAYKAYTAVNTTCTALALLCALRAILFGGGFSAALVVCIIWFVNNEAFCRSSAKYSRLGRKVF